MTALRCPSCRPSRCGLVPAEDYRPGGAFIFAIIRRPYEPEVLAWTFAVRDGGVLRLSWQDGTLTAAAVWEEA